MPHSGQQAAGNMVDMIDACIDEVRQAGFIGRDAG
jgi:hypothetical protein